MTMRDTADDDALRRFEDAVASRPEARAWLETREFMRLTTSAPTIVDVEQDDAPTLGLVFRAKGFWAAARLRRFGPNLECLCMILEIPRADTVGPRILPEYEAIMAGGRPITSDEFPSRWRHYAKQFSRGSRGVTHVAPDDETIQRCADLLEATDPSRFDGLGDDDLSALEGVHGLLLARRCATLIAAFLPSKRAALFLALCKGRPVLDLDDYGSIVTCAAVPNPAWQTEAIVAAPILKCLHTWPRCRFDEKVDPLVDGIAEGASAIRVAEKIIRDIAESQAQVIVLHPTTLRTLSQDMTSSAWGGGYECVSLVKWLDAFYSVNPKHRPFDPYEARTLATYLSEHLPALSSPGRPPDFPARVIKCLMDETGRVGTLAGTYRDAVRSVEDSIDVLLTRVHDFVGTGLHKDYLSNALTAHVAYPDRRRLVGLRRLNEEWHGRIQALVRVRGNWKDAVMARMGNGHVPDRSEPFPHVIEGPAEVEGVTIRPMLTTKDYVSEGEALNHCIGSYAGHARQGKTICLSLVSPSGERSSAAYHVREDGTLGFSEHRGCRNRSPDPCNDAALDKLMRPLLHDPELQRRLAKARSARRENDTKTSRRKSVILPDELRTLLDIEFGNVAPFLSASEAAMGPEAWIALMVRTYGDLAKPDVAKVASTIHPDDMPTDGPGEIAEIKERMTPVSWARTVATTIRSSLRNVLGKAA